MIQTHLHVRLAFLEEVLRQSSDAQLLGPRCAEDGLRLMSGIHVVVLEIDVLVTLGEEAANVAFDRADGTRHGGLLACVGGYLRLRHRVVGGADSALAIRTVDVR